MKMKFHFQHDYSSFKHITIGCPTATYFFFWKLHSTAVPPMAKVGGDRNPNFGRYLGNRRAPKLHIEIMVK